MEGGAARREALAILPKRSPLAVLRKVRGRDAAFSIATARQRDSATARLTNVATTERRDYLGEDVVRELQPAQCQIRIDLIQLATQRLESLAQPARPDHERHRGSRPLVLDPSHDAVNRVRRAVHHTRANALLRPTSDH